MILVRWENSSCGPGWAPAAWAASTSASPRPAGRWPSRWCTRNSRGTPSSGSGSSARWTPRERSAECIPRPSSSLADMIARHGPLPEPAVWRLAAGLAEALRVVHACSLVHRDLKPTNVLLAADGPHVIDFGISRAFEGTTVTAAGMVVGTPGYMSPEQAEGAQAGPASDVFSLGCVLAYAATGNAPFGSGSAASVLYRVVSAQPDLTGLSGSLRDVISACLSKDPSQRPGLTALGATISQAGPAMTATPTSFWPDSVAGVIQAAAVYPTPTQVSAAAARQAQAVQAPAGLGQPAMARPGMAQPGMAQSGMAQ